MAKITDKPKKAAAPTVNKEVKKKVVKRTKKPAVKKVEKAPELSMVDKFMEKVDFLLADIIKFERKELNRQEIEAIARSVLKGL